MKQVILVFALIVIADLAFGQTIPKQYVDLTKKADSLYTAKDFLKSAHNYSEAFKSIGWKALPADRYNAACSWALAAVPDSAFFHLNRLASKSNYTNYGHITTDPDLNSLHSDKRWKVLLEQIKLNKEKVEANFNKPLVAMLDSLYVEDQKYRQQIGGIEKSMAGSQKK